MENHLVRQHTYSLNENYFLVFKCLLLNFTYLLSGHQALRFPFGRYMFRTEKMCFKLAVVSLYVYLLVYASSQICSSYFKSMSFSLVLNPSRVSICRHFIYLAWCFFLLSRLYCPMYFYCFYDGEQCIFVKIVTVGAEILFHKFKPEYPNIFIAGLQ